MSTKIRIVCIIIFVMASYVFANQIVSDKQVYSLELFGVDVGNCSFEITEDENVYKGKSDSQMKISQRNRIANIRFKASTDYDLETLQPIDYICKIDTDDDKSSLISVKVKENKIYIKFIGPTQQYDTSIDLPDNFFILDEHFILDQYQVLLKKIKYPSKSQEENNENLQSFNILIPQRTSVVSKTQRFVIRSIVEEKIRIGDEDIDTYKIDANFEGGIKIILWAGKNDKKLLKYSIPTQQAEAILKK